MKTIAFRILAFSFSILLFVESRLYTSTFNLTLDDVGLCVGSACDSFNFGYAVKLSSNGEILFAQYENVTAGTCTFKTYILS